MREFHGMTYEQISEEVNVREGTVMSRLFHARRNLRRALGETLELSPEGFPTAA